MKIFEGKYPPPILYKSGSVPPAAVISIIPLSFPQVVCVKTTSSITAAGLLIIVAIPVTEQSFTSVTKILKSPAPKSLKIFEDCGRPAFILYIKSAVPPVIMISKEPFAEPQEASPIITSAIRGAELPSTATTKVV